MGLAFRILYAAHANGTHHKLALDGLDALRGREAQQWKRLFYKNIALLIEGSKAPDKEFKDFKNHVLHVRDNHWGGAPGKAQAWYGHLVTALAEEKWDEAAYCAGVMSHYYTDVLMPFHTAQSEAENAIHRACEWSISKSYGEIKRLAGVVCPHVKVDLPPARGDGDHDWVSEAVIDGAALSNMYYEKLIAHYDINAGAADPVTGLDNVSRRFLAKLLCYAASGYGGLVARAIDEAGVAAPSVKLSVQSVMAGLTIPLRWVTRRMEDKRERALVRAMYDELQQTGTVRETLSEDDRMIRDLYIKEVVNAPAAGPAVVHQMVVSEPLTAGPVLPSPMEAVDRVIEEPMPVIAEALDDDDDDNEGYGFVVSRDADLDGDGIPDRLQASAVPPRDTAWQDADVQRFSSHLFGNEEASSAASDDASKAEKAELSPGLLRVRDRQAQIGERLTQVTEADSERVKNDRDDGANLRFYLSLRDPVEDGPSIGPKTAKRLEPAGVHTVADLLNCDAERVAEIVDTRHITPDVIQDWKDQARLCCSIPQLRGGPSQLLVGAGYRSAFEVASAPLDDLVEAVTTYATSSEGQRVLRSSEPPSADKISVWHDRAQKADMSRVALVA